MKYILNCFKIFFSCSIAAFLISCNSGSMTYSIGGIISGLTESNQILTLVNNGQNNSAIIVSGGSATIPFNFANNVTSGGSYNVTVYAQPSNMDCVVINGSGINLTDNITNVVVSCTTNTYPVTVSLFDNTFLTTSQFITLVNNFAYGSPVILSGGEFESGTFNVANNSMYNIQILSQPIGQTCMVMNGVGLINGASPQTEPQVMCNISNITLGGTIYGLRSGESVTLGVMGIVGGTTISESGAFTLNESIPYNSPMYSVYVESTSPSNIICSVSNGSGMNPVNPVTNINVTCGTESTNINVSISGLNNGEVLALLNNSNPNGFIESSNGTFNNAFIVATGAAYNITVASQPSNQTCTVNNGQGFAESDSITVDVICSNSTFPINLIISGLESSNTVSLINNGNLGQGFIESANGTFNNAFFVARGADYNITIVNQPRTQTCTVNNGQGIMINAPVDVFVICSSNTYSVGGSVVGLFTGETIVLSMLGNPNGTIVNGVESGVAESFVVESIAAGGSFNVTVVLQPINKVCTPYNNTGININSDVNDVLVVCSPSESSVSINVNYTGLAAGNTVGLINNGDFNQAYVLNSNTIESSTAFTVAYGSNYNVTVATQPLGQTCTVNNGQGVNIISPATINVVCSNTAYTISGIINNLSLGQTLTFAALDGSTATAIAGSAAASVPFTLNGAISNNGDYNVIIASQPTAETCSVNNPTGTITNASVTNISVTCSNNPVNIGVTIAGLVPGSTLTLFNNADYANAFIANNGNTTYNSAFVVANGSSYNITVAAQPILQTCTINNESGIATTNITLNVNCVSTP